MDIMKDRLLQLENITKSFKKGLNNNLLVLDNINFTMYEGEIIALLEKSGSGKSTLLRIISGLMQPCHGQNFFKNSLVKSAVPGIAMVFQSFALMPWLTVLENVELGLEALGIEPTLRRKKALKAIDTIGLDGFESAYPKELSGGMRQRVGIARALVVEPDLLLLDEAFSALDVLTSENLRTDIMDLWFEKQTKIKGIIQVTHNIEEAALMADRIFIFDSNPGKIKYELSVNIAHPRNAEDPKVGKLIDTIYMHMTEKRKKPSLWAIPSQQAEEELSISIGYRLPDTEISELTGLIEEIASIESEQGNVIELPDLADDLHLDIDDLFPNLEILEILRFIQVSSGKAKPTVIGKKFADADILEKKKIFAKHLISYVPLAKHIRKEIDNSENKAIHQDLVLDTLEQYFSKQEAEKIFKTVINWGRYAEVFAFDYNTGELSLENPN